MPNGRLQMQAPITHASSPPIESGGELQDDCPEFQRAQSVVVTEGGMAED